MAKTMVFIDSRVNDLDLLVSQFAAGTEYKVLDASYDGLLQMQESLAGKSEYSSIQIISHGSAGAITIGSTLLTANNLLQYQSQLDNIGHALTDSGDLLLYGCNVGAGDVGQQFVESLAQMTGADVAASDDLTGGTAAGGDWVLEVKTGSVDSVMLVADVALQQYEHTLGYAEDYTLAKMSLVAYYDDLSNPVDNSDVVTVIKNTWKDLTDAGWVIMADPAREDCPMLPVPTRQIVADGFSATVFKNEQTNQIAIAFRGTQPTDPADILADMAIANPSPAWHDQFEDAISLAHDISKQNASASTPANILVTGHSLGGSLAQVVSKLYGFSGATFDPAGANNITKSNEFIAVAAAKGPYPLSYITPLNLLSPLTPLPSMHPLIVGAPSSFTNYTNGSAVSGTSNGFTIFDHYIPVETTDHIGKIEPLYNPEGIEDLNIALDALHAIQTIPGFDLNTVKVLFPHISYISIPIDDINIFNDMLEGLALKSVYNAELALHSMDGILELMKAKVAAIEPVDFLGTASDDNLFGNTLNNTFRGLAGNDFIFGDDGNDTIYAGLGDDTFFGGNGRDTLILSGKHSDYTISCNDTQSYYTVIDNIADRDGSDRVSNVENFQFSDGVVTAANSLTETAPPIPQKKEIETTKMFPGHTVGEWRNDSAFAALRSDGSVVTWGHNFFGGNSLTVAGLLDGTIDVKQIFSTEYAFAALRIDGSVVTWGGSGEPVSPFIGESGCGGDSSAVTSLLDGTIDVNHIFSTTTAFAAVRADGSVVTWGAPYEGGDSRAVASLLDGTVDVTKVFSAQRTFAALRADGSVVTWGGGTNDGADSSSVAGFLDGTVDVIDVYSTFYAFAALRSDGSVVSWGNLWSGGDSSVVAGFLDGTVDVIQVYSTTSAFAALRSDGSVVTWGDRGYGGDSSAVASLLDGTIDVKQIFSTEYAFAALRADGSVVTWSTFGIHGVNVTCFPVDTVGVIKIFSNNLAFAGLRTDGSIVTWEASIAGGDSSAVAGLLDGTLDVVDVYSTGEAFAALRADGSVVTWGNREGGGDSSAVASLLDGTVDVIKVYSTTSAFAALRADGSVVKWGYYDFTGGGTTGVSDQLTNVVDISNIYTDTNSGLINLQHNNLPTGIVTISGTSIVGQTLTARNTLADAEGLGAISYQWYAGNYEIRGATGSSYLLKQSDVGKTITLTASYLDGHGTDESVMSAVTAAVTMVQSGVAQDGYLAHALVWVDANDNGRLNWIDGNGNNSWDDGEGESWTLTDGNGRFTGLAGAGTLRITANPLGGTVDISTGKPFTGSYSAPSGSTVINPLTTLVVAAGGNGDFVKSALGLDASLDLTTYDPLVSLSTGGRADVATALKAQSAALQMANILDVVSSVTQAGTASPASNSVTDTSVCVASALISSAVNNVSGALNLADSTVIADAIHATAQLIVTDLTASDTIINHSHVIADAAALVNTSIENVSRAADTVSLSGGIVDVASSLTSMVSAQIVVQETLGVEISQVIYANDSSLITITSGNIEQSVDAAKSHVEQLFVPLNGEIQTNHAPTGGVIITGTPIPDTALTASNTLADVDGLGPISYQWLADTTLIADATGSILQLTSALIGKAISVEATYVDKLGFSNSALSAPTADVAISNIRPAQDLTGSATFWKTGLPITAITSTLASSPAVAGTQPIEFRNIQTAADGSRTLEIWETSPTAAINSVQLDLSLPTGSTATWQDATGLPSGWNSSANTDKPGQFILGGIGTTALSAGSVKLGTLTLTAPTNPQHFELSLTAGQLGNDTIPAFALSSDSMTTGTDGLYQHLAMNDGTYTLTSTKVSGTAESNAVKANDALAALKIAVGINPNADGSAVSPYQYLAADVNHDGQVKAADALNILKMAVKLSTAPEMEWLFVPEIVGSESMSRTHVVWPDNPIPVTLDIDQDMHLIGIVKGDVDGSWAV
jgi:hypothetical protein